MAKSYRKGYVAELNLVHKLAESGFMVIRAPRSGRIGLPSPDVVAIKNSRMFAIECKAHAGAFSVEKAQLEQLKLWHANGALPLLAWKQSRKGWVFLHLSDVIANNGNIGKKFAGEKGFPLEKLEQLINYYVS